MKKVFTIIFVIVVISGLSASYIFVGVGGGHNTPPPERPTFQGPEGEPFVEGPTSLPGEENLDTLVE